MEVGSAAKRDAPLGNGLDVPIRDEIRRATNLWVLLKALFCCKDLRTRDVVDMRPIGDGLLAVLTYELEEGTTHVCVLRDGLGHCNTPVRWTPNTIRPYRSRPKAPPSVCRKHK